MLACEQGDGRGCVGTGNLHRYGKGFAQDLGQAAAWYRRGAALGNANAEEQLAKLQAGGLSPNATRPGPATEGSEFAALPRQCVVIAVLGSVPMPGPQQYIPYVAFWATEKGMMTDTPFLIGRSVQLSYQDFRAAAEDLRKLPDTPATRAALAELLSELGSKGYRVTDNDVAGPWYSRKLRRD